MKPNSYLGKNLHDKDASTAAGLIILDVLTNLVDEYRCLGSDLRNYYSYIIDGQETIYGEIDKLITLLRTKHSIITFYDEQLDVYNFYKYTPTSF